MNQLAELDLEDIVIFIERHKEDLDSLTTIRRAAAKHEKKLKEARKASKVKHLCTSEAKEIAEYMAKEIHQRFWWLEPNLEDMGEQIDYIHRIDGHPFEIIKRVAIFSQTDDFWRQNIRSGQKLRKHFTSLLIKAKDFHTKTGIRKI